MAYFMSVNDFFQADKNNRFHKQNCIAVLIDIVFLFGFRNITDSGEEAPKIFGNIENKLKQNVWSKAHFFFLLLLLVFSSVWGQWNTAGDHKQFWTRGCVWKERTVYECRIKS